MLNRWFFAPRSPSGSNGGNHTDDDSPVKEADFIVLPATASDSWRTWLMTGIRKRPFDRRRVRGDHKGLKKMLVEGTPPNDGTLPSNDFSSAMVRQSVDEALWNTLKSYDPATKSWTTLGTGAFGARSGALSVMLPLKAPYTSAQVVQAGGLS